MFSFGEGKILVKFILGSSKVALVGETVRRGLQRQYDVNIGGTVIDSRLTI